MRMPFSACDERLSGKADLERKDLRFVYHCMVRYHLVGLDPRISFGDEIQH